MSPSEAVNYANFIQTHGSNDGVVMAAYDEVLSRAKTDKRVSVTKMSVAAAVAGGTLGAKLLNAQEEVFEQRKIGGKWAILADKSGSMSKAVEGGKQAAAVLSKLVDEAHLVFFDTVATHIVTTGMTLSEIEEQCRGIKADGGTSIGVGLRLLARKKIVPDAIVIISDGIENTQPYFGDVYSHDLDGARPDVYHISLSGGYGKADRFLNGIENITIDGNEMDYYSLPNMIVTMKADKYKLLDEINNSRLWTIEEALHER